MKRMLKLGTPDYPKTSNVHGAPRRFSIGVAGPSDTASLNSSRFSIKEDFLMKILGTPVDQPLSQQSESSQETFATTPSQKISDFEDLMQFTPPSALGFNSAMTPKNQIYTRLYKDLNSPSATTRCRALRALKSPSKLNNYLKFDVPHDEQDIITAADRISPVKTTIQEIMKNVVVYIEVRSGADNRSDGIKDHVAMLGAKVNDKLYRDTTHVIFKDGLMSTYCKAKKMNIPIVSILWIEACKRQMKLMDTEKFKIFNIERYENPELFKKIRRQKSMQPRAEQTLSSKKKTKASPAAIPSSFIASPPTKLPVLHRRKDDGLEKILADFHAEIMNTPEQNDDDLMAAPLGLLERIRNSPFIATESTEKPNKKPISIKRISPEKKAKTIRKSLFCNNNEEETPPRRVSARRSCMLNNASPVAVVTTPTPVKNSRRKTMLPAKIEDTIIEEENETALVSETENSYSIKGNKEEKRGTIYTPKALEVSALNEKTPEIVTKQSRQTIYTPQVMDVVSSEQNEISQIGPTSLGRRNTIFEANMTQTIAVEEIEASALSEAQKTTSKKGNKEGKRGTIYTPKALDVSALIEKTPEIESTQSRQTIYTPQVMDVSQALNKRRTLYTPNVPQNELSPLDKRRTVFKANVDETTDEIPKIVNKRRTLFNPCAEILFGKKSEDKRRSFLDPYVEIKKAGVNEETLNTENSKVVNKRRTFFTPNIEKLEHTVQDNPKIVNKRRTLFTPNSEAIPVKVTEKTLDDTPKTGNKRRTLFTPNPMLPNDQDELIKKTVFNPSTHKEPASAQKDKRKTIIISENTKENDNPSKVSNKVSLVSEQTPRGTNRRCTFYVPNQTDIIEHPSLNQPGSAIIPKSKTMLEEYESNISFSSTKTPINNKRRTIYDISMDIIDQRVNLINQNAKINPSFSDNMVENSTVSTEKRAPTDSFSECNEPTSTKKRKLFITADLSLAHAQSVEQAEASAVSNPAKKSKPAEESPFVEKKAVSRRTTLLFQPSKLNASLPQSQPKKRASKRLSVTNMHHQEANFVKKAVTILGEFELDEIVTDKTTHLVTFETRRTINILRGIIRGVWIVTYQWVVDSLEQGQWLNEEQYEMNDFSKAVQSSRSERQAFGADYKIDLFIGMAPFYISPKCKIPQDDLRELISSCAGKVVENKRKAKYILGEYHKNATNPSDAIVVDPIWILDCISLNKIIKFQKYCL